MCTYVFLLSTPLHSKNEIQVDLPYGTVWNSCAMGSFTSDLKIWLARILSGTPEADFQEMLQEPWPQVLRFEWLSLGRS